MQEISTMQVRHSKVVDKKQIIARAASIINKQPADKTKARKIKIKREELK